MRCDNELELFFFSHLSFIRFDIVEANKSNSKDLLKNDLEEFIC